MRLWHYKLISYLPRQQLIAQWRECCAIANNLASIGCFCLDEYSAYTLLVKAYKNKDYEKAIALAIRIRDAWREVK